MAGLNPAAGVQELPRGELTEEEWRDAARNAGVPMLPGQQCKHINECTDQRACYGPEPGCRRALGVGGTSDA